MLNVLPHLREKFHLNEISWNFFAASHGKGPVDGLGGLAKRTASGAVLRRKSVITCAADFHRTLVECQVSFNVLLVNDPDEFLQRYDVRRAFESAPQVHGISSDHAWRSLADGSVSRASHTSKLSLRLLQPAPLPPASVVLNAPSGSACPSRIRPMSGRISYPPQRLQ
jgi:hypothetical protein